MNKPVWVRKPTEELKAKLEACPTWEREPDQWACASDEREETFLVVDGRALVELRDGTRYRFSVGDLVTFQPHQAGDWTWIVEEKIKKHYIFDMTN